MLPLNLTSNVSATTKEDSCRYLFLSGNVAAIKAPFQCLIDAALAKIRQEQEVVSTTSILDLSLPNKRARTEDNQPMALVVTRKNDNFSSSPISILNSAGEEDEPTSSIDGCSPMITTPDDNGFRCHECGKILPTRVGLKRHVFYHAKPFINADDCPYKCDVCPAAFSYRTSLEYHRVSHFLDGKERLSNGSYQCDKCGKVFDGLKMLKRHKMKRISNGDLNCSSTLSTSSNSISPNSSP